MSGGSKGGGSIIDQVANSHQGLANASMDVEIAVADHPSDYVPMTDHRAVVSFIVLQPHKNMHSSGVDLSKFINLTWINP